MKQSARFWIYWHDWTKLTLKPGQTLHHSYTNKDEEGWSRCAASWEHRGDAVVEKSYFEGRDCDGRISTSKVFRCPIGLLQSVREECPDQPMPPRPDWEEVNSWQRDYAAEAMGY